MIQRWIDWTWRTFIAKVWSRESSFTSSSILEKPLWIFFLIASGMQAIPNLNYTLTVRLRTRKFRERELAKI